MTTINIIWTVINSILIIAIPVWANNRLEKLKSSLSKGEFIHQTRFNREFDIYQFLWKKLATLIRKSELLQYSGFFNSQGGDSRAQESGKALAETFEVLDNNIPFFSPTVYEPAKKILDLINKETSSIRLALSPGFRDPKPEDFEKVKEAIAEIRPYVEEVKMAIRKRIYDEVEK